MNKAPTYDAVIFDMDGLIFDTERLVQEAWQQVADKYGIPDVKAACIECLGLNQKVAEQRFRARYGQDFDYWKYKEEMRAIYWGPLYGEHLPLKPGVVELLQALKERKIKFSLATSTSRKTARKELADAGILDYFDALVCGDMVSHSKPDPEIYLTACKVLEVEPARAFALEDSYNGIRSAYDGGLMPVMVPDMLAPTEEMREKCVAIFDSLHLFREWILGTES